jgi:hypothetical protein
VKCVYVETTYLCLAQFLLVFQPCIVKMDHKDKGAKTAWKPTDYFWQPGQVLRISVFSNTRQ